MLRNIRACLCALLILATAGVAVGQDFQLQIGDAGGNGNANNWPGAEGPENAINWVGQKYLNFAGDEPDVASGFLVQPTEGVRAGDVPTSITFWTANDAEGRDPASYQLFGSNSVDIPAPVTNLMPGDQLSLDLFTLISEGDLALPSERNAGGENDLFDPNWFQTVEFDNSTAYDNYLVLFPTLKDAAGNNSMQIAEVQLNAIDADPITGIFDEFDPIVGLAYLDVTPPPMYEMGDPVGDQPEPGAGFWSVREWNVPAGTYPDLFPVIDSVDAAIAAIENPDLQGTNVVSDGYAEMINFADPEGAGGGYSIAAPKQAFFSNTEVGDEDFVLRARGKVIIPEDGTYTFGVDGDDGFRLNIDGELFMEFPTPTGDAFTLEFGDFTAGEHDVELIWFERGGGAFVELFAAAGEKEALDDDFAPVGFKGFDGEVGQLPTMKEGWNVRTVTSDTALNSIADAQAALTNGTEAANESGVEVVNYGAGDNGRFGSSRSVEDTDEVFPGGLNATDDFALQATGTVVIAEDGDYVFGFDSDDGGILCIDGADFTVFNEGGARSVSGDGECIQFDANTGNADTSGTTPLTAGEYEISFTMWERGGGEQAEVFASVGSAFEGVDKAELLGRPAQEINTAIASGLLLGGPSLEFCDPNSQGDLDGNGTVEFADFLVLSGNFGNEVADHTEGDIDCNGVVEFADFLVLSANFGTQVGGAASVPEPSSFALIGLASLLMGCFRRRR